MVSLSVLCTELNSRGFDVEKKYLDLEPDQKTIKGVLVNTPDVNKQLVFDLTEILMVCPDVNSAADYLADVINNSILPDNIDYSKYLTKKYVLDNVRLSYCKKYWAPYLIRDSIFSDIAQNCYIYGIENGLYWSVDIRQDLIEELGITEKALWKAAEKNTYHNPDDFVLRPVKDILGKKEKKRVANSPARYLHSISNRMGLYGSVQLESKRIFDLFEQYKVDSILVYPQSVKNFLVAPQIDDVKKFLLLIARNDSARQCLSNQIYELKRAKDRLVVVDSVEYKFDWGTL